ncbi:MAG: S9 family peptidase [Balneolaceae bacterium]|nr:S9 family peptidase [Balneolaceae bacterium]
MKKTILTFLIALISITTGFAQQGVDTLSLESIFYEPLLAGNRPELIRFSPDQQSIYYHANDSSMMEEELFMVDLNGENRTRANEEDFQRGYDLSPDGRHIAYTQDGDIWLADPSFANARKVVASDEQEYNLHWSPDSKRLAFVQNGNVWIIDINQPGLTQVTNKKEDEPGYNISAWAGNDKLILQQYDRSDYKEYYFPEYVSQYVETGRTERGIARHILSVARLDSIHTKQLFEGKGYISTSVSSNGQYVALDRTGPDMKKRTIEVYDLAAGDSTVVFKDSTKGWLYGTEIAFAPEGNKLMILSEKDGWNHIYTVEPDGSSLTQHTEGQFEVPWAEWLDGTNIVFASTEADPGERHIYTLNTTNDNIKKLTSKTGYRQSFALGPDKHYLVYEYTYFNEPFELYALNLQNPREETRLTQTIPDRFNQIDWQQEDYIRLTGRDGETRLSMSVLEPLDMQEGEHYPVVVFIHGAGSLQNVYKGWSNSYYREYMFHQYLTAHGYYVMEVDYRHSTGYGRDFREDVTGWMGKYETRDIVDGINYLAENYPQADTSRVGTYGGSYGGFMALYATSVAPGYFDAAAALRAVTNWENYYYTNPWYTRPRLGTPEADSVNYARSSPITYADSLQQPVLILHGLIDNNVGFQDAAQYIDELIQSGNKEFDMMMYPTERHSFEDPDAWFDEYTRIFEFFEEYLKNREARNI